MRKINYSANNCQFSIKKIQKTSTGILLLFMLPLVSLAGKNDKWVDCGLRGSFNSTWLLNLNVLNDKYSRYDFSFGYSAGARLGFNFSEELAIGVEGLFSQYSQKYYSNSVSFSWNREIQIRAIDVPVLFKYTKDFSFVEIGPQFSFIQNASETFTSNPVAAFDYNKADVISKFNSTNIGLTFGWGSILWASGGLSISTGLRVNYFFTDLINDNGGQGKNYPFPVYPGYPPSEASKPYKSTNLSSVGIMVYIDYDLGYVVTSACKRSRKFVFFNH
jgi:hypothetical protein